MTYAIGDRIKVQKLVDVLNTLTFENVTSDVLTNKLLAKVVVSDYNTENLKDIHVDDYVFTIYPTSDDEGVGVSGLRVGIDGSIFLSDGVVVFLPCNHIGNEDIEGIGQIVNNDGNLELHVNYIVE